MNKEMIGGCCVCSDERGWAENPLVYCDGLGCNVAVHQACYGIVSVPLGPWYCRKCESQERSPRVRCELCPSKDGALKRTDGGGWAHVVCALYIPEVRFGNVTSMEPIVLQLVPTERYNKSCYICEQQGRQSKSTVGACMQCNRAGCKQHFHVTCAQAHGLLCEEAGNYMDNVKYCGYCSFHYSKLRKGSNVKTMPPFKPIPADNATPDTTPDKSVSVPQEDKESKSQGKKQRSNKVNSKQSNEQSTVPSPKPLTGADSDFESEEEFDKDFGTKFTTVNFKEATILMSESVFGASVGSSSTSGKTSKGKPRKGGSRTPNSIASNDTESTLSNVSDLGKVADVEIKEEKKEVEESAAPPTPPVSTHNEVHTNPVVVLPITTLAASSTSSSSSSSSSKNTAAPTTPTTSASTYENFFGTALKSSGKEESTSPGKRQRSDSGAEKDVESPKKQRRTSTKSRSRKGGGSGSQPNSPESSSEPKKGHKRKKSDLQRWAETGEVPTLPSSGVQNGVSTADTQPTPAATTSSQPSVETPSTSTTPVPSTSTTPPVTTQATTQETATTTTVTTTTIATPSSTTIVGPSYPGKKPFATPSTGANNINSQPFPQTLEQLLERHWEEGSEFLMSQAQHFDVASFLSVLHQLRQENLRLEELVASQSQRRDHLLAINARLSVPLQNFHQQYSLPSTTATNTPAHTTQATHRVVSNSPGETQTQRSPRGGFTLIPVENGVMQGEGSSITHRSSGSSSQPSPSIRHSPANAPGYIPTPNQSSPLLHHSGASTTLTGISHSANSRHYPVYQMVSPPISVPPPSAPVSVVTSHVTSQQLMRRDLPNESSDKR